MLLHFLRWPPRPRAPVPLLPDRNSLLLAPRSLPVPAPRGRSAARAPASRPPPLPDSPSQISRSPPALAAALLVVPLSRPGETSPPARSIAFPQRLPRWTNFARSRALRGLPPAACTPDLRAPREVQPPRRSPALLTSAPAL